MPSHPQDDGLMDFWIIWILGFKTEIIKDILIYIGIKNGHFENCKFVIFCISYGFATIQHVTP